MPEDHTKEPRIIKRKTGIPGQDGELLNRVDGLNAATMLEVERKRKQARDLAEELGGEVNVVLDSDTDQVYLELEVPPIVTFDEERGVLLCEDPNLARMIRLVTNGDKERIKRIVGSHVVRKSILRDHDGWIRLKLLANYLDDAVSRKVADPAKRVLEMIDAHEEKHKAPKPKYGNPTPHIIRNDERRTVGNLLGVDNEGKKSGEKKEA